MISTPIRRVFLATHRVDFRRRFDGLLSEAYQLGADPYQGDCVLFIKKDHTQLRAIVGDGVGLYLVCRRFEGGRINALAAFTRDPGITEITMAELSLLLEGATFTVHRRARPWRGAAKAHNVPIEPTMGGGSVRATHGVESTFPHSPVDP